MSYFTRWMPFFQESLILCMEYGWPSLVVSYANKVRKLIIERHLSPEIE